MNLKKQLQSEMDFYRDDLTKAAAAQFLLPVTVAAHIFIFFLSRKANLFPDNDALMQVISCCSEIIAGLYGITLAGYTFFLSRMDSLMATDATLDYIVTGIKQRFKGLIWYITFNVGMTLFISIFLMYYPVSSNVIPEFLYRLICNEFVLFLVFSISLILYYSVSIVDPNCLANEAKKRKKKLGGRWSMPGSTVEFIALYDRIEQRCNAMLPESVLNQLHENKGKHFEYTLELLQERNPAIRPLLADLTRIHRYYECSVNCSPMSVSQDMCNLAKRVLAALSQIEGRLPTKP